MSSKNGIIRNSDRHALKSKLEAQIVSGGAEYTGFIENVSEHGLNIVVFYDKCITTFIPCASLELEFQPFTEKIKLTCEIKWVNINKKPSNDLIYTLALGITEQPSEYKNFLKTLK